MDPDLALVLGLVLGVISIPSILSAFSEGRPPRVAAIAAIMSGGLIVWALSRKPGGYTINDIPDVLVGVVARYLG